MPKNKDNNDTPVNDEVRLIQRPFTEELSESYINYSMSVILGRALPDVRDGMKPVHRRILFGMRELKVWHNTPFKKSARIVGDVMGKYHPHGDAAIYNTMVRMAQDFSMRYPLVDPQGNFGSIDNDPPAAPRYTEARLSKIAEELLADLDKNTVNMRLNFDETMYEPEVLPSALPNLLMNGASGIAVGMATNIPPHNLDELVDGLVALIDDPEIDIPGLMQYIKGPDFPTGGKILGKEILREVYENGSGSIQVEGIYEIEEDRIIITEIPYGVCKATMIQQIAEYFKKLEKKMIKDIRDESDRRGMRVVIEIARNSNPRVVLNHILKHSSLRTTFPANMRVIDAKKRPRIMNLKQLLTAFLEHRYEVVRRRSEYELAAASKRAHIVEGLIRAVRSIDTTVDIIRHSKNQQDATNNLMEALEVSEEQAKAILDLRLGRLTNIEIGNLRDEMSQLNATISRLKTLLSESDNIHQEEKKNLLELKEKYSSPRRTIIHKSRAETVDIEDLVVEEEIVITITNRGYILQSPLDAYRNQNRGGRGAKGIRTREEDFVKHIMVTSKLSNTFFVSSTGKAYTLKNYEVEPSTKGTKGKHIMTYLKLNEGEVIRTVLKIGKDFSEEFDVVFITAKGKIKRTSLKDFARSGTSGVIGIKVEDGDRVVDAILVDSADENLNIFIGTSRGMAIRIKLADLRRMGRNAMGVKAINLKKDDIVVSLTSMKSDEAQTVLTVTERGFGKRTPIEEYRLQSRGGTGIKNFAWNSELGEVVGVQLIEDTDEIIAVTKLGFTIRFSASDIRKMGRVTRGVKAIDLTSDDQVASIERIPYTEENNQQ